MIIEQIVYEFPDDGYGGKSADKSRPFSKDSIAMLMLDGRLYSCDWQNGATRAPHADLHFEAATGQHFIPVPGINHLGTGERGPEPEPPTSPPRDKDAAIDALLADIALLRAELAQTNADLASLAGRPLPPYKGKVFGITVTSHPVQQQ
jgi:hypothetical protein